MGLHQYNKVSYFGRVVYDYDNKYLLTGTVRRDGSSNWSQSALGNFPAFSLGWNVNNENFWPENKIINTLTPWRIRYFRK
jgi:hypothetical protein